MAEMGPYKELSNRPDGAFTKLMEWQMSGGEAAKGDNVNKEMGITAPGGQGPPTESEELEHLLHTGEAEGEEGEEDIRSSKEEAAVEQAVETKK